MLPDNFELKENKDSDELEDDRLPSFTYKLDLNSKRIVGKIDDILAIEQAVIKLLNTERYRDVIYSDDYGIELINLIGKNYDFVIANLPRIITEALSVDDRILGIEDFTVVEKTSDYIAIKFTVNTISGNLEFVKEVKV